MAVLGAIFILKYYILFLSVENLVVKAVSLLKDASNGDVERQDNITRKVFNVLSPNEKELSFLRNEFYSMVSHFCFVLTTSTFLVSCGCCDFKSCVSNTTEIRSATVPQWPIWASVSNGYDFVASLKNNKFFRLTIIIAYEKKKKRLRGFKSHP